MVFVLIYSLTYLPVDPFAISKLIPLFDPPSARPASLRSLTFGKICGILRSSKIKEVN